jgi:TonB family protein
VYPDTAIKAGIEGRVVVKFIVTEDGSVTDITISKGVSKEIDEEALRVMRMMPKWKPGRQNGKPVKVYFTLPIQFKLDEEKAQPTTDTAGKKKADTFQYVEVMPKPTVDISEYLSKNMKYPKAARRAGIEGKVIVRFVVTTDGSIDDVTVVKGIGKECDDEAVRVIQNMTKWTPGTQNGKPVNVFFTIPINFQLAD